MLLDRLSGGASRRELLKLSAALGVVLVAPVAGAMAAAPEPWADTMRQQVAALSETILPATDTGGAKAAGVPAFIEKMVAQWFDPAERDHFLAGLKAFDADVRVRHGRPFAQLSAADQNQYFGAVLKAAEAEAAAALAGQHTPFAALMKRLTVYGYYTSEIGATEELALHMVASAYVPDAPFEPGDRANSFVTLQLLPFSAF